jgi:hypothetical protein
MEQFEARSPVVDARYSRSPATETLGGNSAAGSPSTVPPLHHGVLEVVLETAQSFWAWLTSYFISNVSIL